MTVSYKNKRVHREEWLRSRPRETL